VFVFYVTWYMLQVSILFEDQDVVVINKPAGLVVHADGKTNEPTLVDWVLEKYPETKGVGEPYRVDSRNKIQDSSKEGKKAPDSVHESCFINPESTIDRPGIVHRLDRETSGVLVIAKNQKAFEFLKKQFQEREMEKTYRAFVYGELKNDEGIIDRPIARSTSDFRKWTATRGRRGKEREAITEYRVLNRYQGPSLGTKDGPWYSFLELYPRTGRTHQIRVHLKALNHPIVCDKLYAPKHDCALGFSRLALHAFSLKFKLPSGKVLTVEAPYPEDFIYSLQLF